MTNSSKRLKTAEASEKNARDRLLETALDEFGRHGFEATTTRVIARRAGVNLALIAYYFAGKKGLYRAVVDLVADRIESHLNPVLHKIEACKTKGDCGQADAAALMESLLGGMVDLMVGSDQATRLARIIVREQLSPSTSYDIIFSRILAPLIQAIADLLTAIKKPAAADPEYTRLRAFSLLGQVMIFRVARETVVRLMGMQGYTATETERVRQVVLEQTRMTIERWAAGDILAEKAHIEEGL